MKCPKCNNSVSDGSRFCNYCGEELLTNGLECPNCHSKDLPLDSKFCPDCGCKLEVVDEDPENDREDWYDENCDEIEELEACPICGSEDGWQGGEWYLCNECGYYYIPGCPSCGSHEKVHDDNTNWRQYHCDACDHVWGTPLRPHEDSVETNKDKKGNPICNYFEINGFVLGVTTYDEIWRKSSMNDYNPKERIWIDEVSYAFKDGILSEVSWYKKEDLPAFYKRVGLYNKDIFIIAKVLEKGLGFKTDVMDLNPRGIDDVYVRANIPLSTKYGRFLEISYHKVGDDKWITVYVCQTE